MRSSAFLGVSYFARSGSRRRAAAASSASSTYFHSAGIDGYDGAASTAVAPTPHAPARAAAAAATANRRTWDLASLDMQPPLYRPRRLRMRRLGTQEEEVL